MPNLDKSKMKLVRETRWHREYALEEPNHLFQESKFADGSASVTLEELEKEWPTWSEWERIDFRGRVYDPRLGRIQGQPCRSGPFA